MKQSKIIAYHTQQLEKIKNDWGTNNGGNKERGEVYIKAAENRLEAAKNGRNW